MKQCAAQSGYVLEDTRVASSVAARHTTCLKKKYTPWQHCTASQHQASWPGWQLAEKKLIQTLKAHRGGPSMWQNAECKSVCRLQCQGKPTYGCRSLLAFALHHMLCIGSLSPAAYSCHQCSPGAAGLSSLPWVQQLQTVAADAPAVALHCPAAAVKLPAAAAHVPAQHQFHLHPGRKQEGNQETVRMSDGTQASKQAARISRVDETRSVLVSNTSALQRTWTTACVSGAVA